MSPLIINITTKSITINVKIIHTYEKSAKHYTELLTYEKSAKHNTELSTENKSGCATLLGRNILKLELKL